MTLRKLNSVIFILTTWSKMNAKTLITSRRKSICHLEQRQSLLWKSVMLPIVLCFVLLQSYLLSFCRHLTLVVDELDLFTGIVVILQIVNDEAQVEPVWCKTFDFQLNFEACFIKFFKSVCRRATIPIFKNTYFVQVTRSIL